MPHSTILSRKTYSFKLVCDNLDINIKSRFVQMEGSGKKSLHFFHSYAVYSKEINDSTMSPQIFINSASLSSNGNVQISLGDCMTPCDGISVNESILRYSIAAVTI